MKIEILKDHLTAALGIAAGVSNKNLSLPVLGCVVIAVSGDKAVLKATNLDVSVEASLKAKIISEGIVAVPAQTLTQTINTLIDQKLTLSAEGNSLVINGEHSTTSITAVDSAEFPTLPYVKKTDTSAILSAQNFTTALKSVVFAASTSSVKPELSSVALSLEKGELTAVATDSFRLAEVKIPVKIKNGFPTTLIPARNVPGILRAIDGAGDIEVRVDDNQCSFIAGFGYLTSRTIDGAFPDYRAIIPKESVASATCLTEDAVRAFRKAAIFADAFNQVHLSFKRSEKSFTVQALNASVGEAIDHIPAAIDGEDSDINFNARYVSDALAVIATDSVSFSVAGPGKPMLITDIPRKGFTYLVMPMNR